MLFSDLLYGPFVQLLVIFKHVEVFKGVVRWVLVYPFRVVSR